MSTRDSSAGGDPLSVPEQPCHVVVVIGGAVAGSEAAALCAERGLIAIVIEQNDRPFGKIEDGLPRWHEKLRIKEYERIGVNMTRPGVVFVPSTQVGEEVEIRALLDDWGVSAVLLANGAWRDRPVPVPGADNYLGRGLAYQNPLVYWYNHYPDDGYDGERYDIRDDAIVLGGGLASIDVVKIINLELYKRALASRGIAVTTVALEHAGIPKTLAAHGLTADELGVKGCTLYYRREKDKMPLASAPPDASPSRLAKLGATRTKIMNKVIDKYLVNFQPNHTPVGLITEGDQLVGLRFQKTRTVDGKLTRLDEFVDVRGSMIVSSIGSIPRPIPGLRMKGELLDWKDWDTGELNGFDNVYGLGNVLTGKGNIKASRKNAKHISAQVIRDYLGVGDGEPEMDAAHQAAREAARPAVDATMRRPPMSREQIGAVLDKVRACWARVGYNGDYRAWIEKFMPTNAE